MIYRISINLYRYKKSFWKNWPVPSPNIDPFITLMGNFNWGSISHNNIISMKIREGDSIYVKSILRKVNQSKRKTSSYYRQHTWGGGWMMRWCWVNFQCRGILLIWMRVRQGPTALAVYAGGGCLDFFLSSIISLFFLPLSGRRPDIDWNTVSKGR